MEKNMIEKLKHTSDLLQMHIESKKIINQVQWGEMNQIGLNSRLNCSDAWHDAVGSLYDKKALNYRATEYEFTEWNIEPDNYLRQQIEQLVAVEQFNLGRVRLMRLLPHRGLSVHRDDEVRYHFVLKTNQKAYFAFNNDQITAADSIPEIGKFYHVPMDGNWYKADTRQVHWVYNGGETERIHLVVCGSK